MLTNDQLLQQIPYTLKGTNFVNLGKKYEGKVRDNYTQATATVGQVAAIAGQVAKGGFLERRIIIVTDRLSAFDRVITTIPFKGQVLNQMAQFWFEQTKDIIGNHAIEFPDPNVVVGIECKALPVEMVVRGYLTGVTTTSAWHHYKNGGRNFCGNVLPDGMKKDQKFEKPILTPSTKAGHATATAGHGGHDESVSRDEIVRRGLLTEKQFDTIASAALALYERGVAIAAEQGIILVDTKYEFGLNNEDEIVLIDEIHTPDSSRFWFADGYAERFERGEEQKKIDKEYLRKWLADKGFTGEGEIPVVPDEERVETARRYIEAFELITGRVFEAEVGDVLERLTRNLQKYMS